MSRKSHKNKVYSAERKLQAVQDYLAGKGKRMKHLKRRWIPSSLHNHPPTLTGGYAMLFQIFWLRVSQGQIDYPLTQKMLNLLLQFAPKKYLWNPQKSC